MKIIVTIGKRSTDRIHLEIQDIHDAVKVYNAAHEETGSDAQAALVLEMVNNGEFEVEE